MTSLTVPQTDLDLQVLLQDKLEMAPKDFEAKFDVAEADGKLILSVHKDGNGRFVWLETHLWTVVNDYVRALGGTYFKPERKWEIPKKDGDSTPIDTPKDTPVPKTITQDYDQMRSRIESKLTKAPIKLDAHERMENNINNLKEAGQSLDADGYDLKKSKEAIGPLVPILEDRHGNIIDGFHREHSND